MTSLRERGLPIQDLGGIRRMGDELDDTERARPPIIADYESVKTLISPVVDGVTIPNASPALLWKTKQTFHEKDAIDRSL